MEFEYDLEENRSLLRRHRGLFVVLGIVVLGTAIVLAAIALSRRNQQTISHSDDLLMLQLPPLPTPTPPPRPTPPPQPTPPPPEERQDRQMLDQQPVKEEKKTDAPKEKPLDAPAPLGTGITGPGGGPDLGLGSGLGGGGGYGDGGGGGSKYGWYASEVQDRIADAVRNDRRMRGGAMNVIVRIWPDATGRIIKATVSSGGNTTFESTVQDSILTGLQLPDPPPADMPLPIVMRLEVQQSR
jgi:periplasmic protein TonB